MKESGKEKERQSELCGRPTQAISGFKMLQRVAGIVKRGVSRSNEAQGWSKAPMKSKTASSLSKLNLGNSRRT